MRLPSIRKDPEPEQPVIKVTSTGEQRAPPRGRGRKADPEKVVESFKKPVTIRERFGKARPEQPTYAEQEPGGVSFDQDTAALLEKNRNRIPLRAAMRDRDEEPPDHDWVKLITSVVFGILAVGLIALGAILFSLPTSPANIAWIHAETAGLAIMLVLLYIKK